MKEWKHFPLHEYEVQVLTVKSNQNSRPYTDNGLIVSRPIACVLQSVCPQTVCFRLAERGVHLRSHLSNARAPS